jgi:hypothetical protein
LIEEIKSALDENAERDAFILALQTSDKAFAPINFMQKFTINDEEIELIETNKPIPWIYIGPGIGVGALAVSLIGFLFVRRRRDDSMSFIEGEFREPTLPSDPRVQSTIDVIDQDLGDMSTLGDPVNPHGHNMFTEVQSVQEDEVTNQSHLSLDYDYKRAYGGAGDEASVSTAGGTKSVYAPHAPADKINDENSSRSRFNSDASSSRMKSVAGHISLFSEDESFEAMYNEEEKFVVAAPPGKLGIVIDRPSAGIPVVHAIKDTSVLVSSVRIGDKLIAVDGLDTTSMSAIQVSKLISSKAQNTRMMTFIRPRNE